MVQMLIRHGADVNLCDFRGNSPLHNSAAVNSYEICGILLKQGNSSTYSHNYSLTHSFSFLLTHSLTHSHPYSGADPDAFDFSNEKAIQKTNNPNIIKMLEKASQMKKDGNEEGIQQSINYMGNQLAYASILFTHLLNDQSYRIRYWLRYWIRHGTSKTTRVYS